MNQPCLMSHECDMVPIAQFLPELLVIPNMLDDIAAHAVLHAAIEFCDRSKVLVQELPVDLQCGVTDTFIEPNCGMRVVAINKFSPTADCSRGVNLYTGSQPMLSRFECNGAGFRFVPPITLMLDKPPLSDKATAFWVLVSVAPDREACELPRMLFDRHYDAIVAGAMARLYKMEGVGITDIRKAREREKDFTAKITAANLERLMGYGMGPVEMRPRRRMV